MSLDGVLHGDPLEASALEGIRWHWNATSHTARPQHSSDGLRETPVLKSDNDKADAPPSSSSSPSKRHSKARNSKTAETSGAAGKSEEAGEAEAVVEGLEDEDGGVDGGVKEVAGGVGDTAGVAVAVWRRYAFSSQLQRMSVVAEVSGDGLTADSKAPEVLQKSNWQRGDPGPYVALLFVLLRPPLFLLRSLAIVSSSFVCRGPRLFLLRRGRHLQHERDEFGSLRLC